RTFTLDLSFLGRGKFTADYFGDVPGDATKFAIERGVQVDAKTTRTIQLGAGGGFVARIR
ncbi:MAG TPA: glycoside hydrolase family 97 C-terminal domain-containing protein, partial [Clostridia bacterium]|nr:glycoside hydrolase family 97 C-terminal domain-containing protein [Clostridia bacterium]